MRGIMRQYVNKKNREGFVRREGQSSASSNRRAERSEELGKVTEHTFTCSHNSKYGFSGVCWVYVEVEVNDVENGDGDGKCVKVKDGCRMR